MTYTQGSTIAGFTLKQHEFIEEIDSQVFLFEHGLLGCPLFAIKNSDPNKTFAVAFNTIPTDSTGVAHILEHSVLMGSRKYPVKDVFGEINKGGLMTFLNAMTGSDVTYYPFATRNLKEYFNLMDVYCDVVFNPLLLSETFEQEGWHYHKESSDDILKFQGVVYNEMKGAFSDPIRILFKHIYSGLMPESTYSHESGGDPKEIPNLTYEQFRTFHRDHYHPSNATFFLYGDADIEDELRYLQDRFLASFTSRQERKTVETGKLIDTPISISDTYGVESADISGKTFLTVGSHIGKVSEREKNSAFQIIANILYNSDGSPLKNRIVSGNICKDFGGLYLCSSSLNTIMMTYLVGSEPEHLDTFKQIYHETLSYMVEQTLDNDLVVSELNKFEFSVREEASKAQRGLELIGKAMTAFKYDTDPFDVLKSEKLLEEIRNKALNENYFEELIRDNLLENPATVTVTLSPDPEKNKKSAQQEQELLNRYENGLEQTQVKKLVARTEELMQLQQTPNDSETLAILPNLSLRDLPADISFHAVEAQEMAGSTLLVNELPTNRISYLDIGFDFSTLPHRYLPLLDLFGAIITEIGTEKLNYVQFAKKVGICTGGLSHSINTYARKTEPDTVRLVLWVGLKALPEYLEQAIDLLTELFSGVSFKDRARISEIVRREFAWAEHAAQSEGYSLPATRVFSHLSVAGRYQEQFTGITAYAKLKELVNNYPDGEDALIEDLCRMAEILLNRNNLTITITADGPELKKFLDYGSRIVESLPDMIYPQQPVVPAPTFADHEAFVTAAEVVFVIQGGTLLPAGKGYNGSFEVLKTYLSRDYLWNNVRQMGGAYGCFIQFSHITGNIAFVSYRDPQVRKTYEVYNRIPEIISAIDMSDQILEQIIIGTYGAFDPHQSAAARGATARNEYLSGITVEQKHTRIEEIIATTADDLRTFAPYFEKMNAECHRAVIGNRARIENDRNLFDLVSEL